MSQTSGTVTFLFCDLVGSTELLARVGNEASEDVRRRYFAALREAILVSFGEEVKGLGDGLMVAFRSSPSDALACAAAIRAGMGLLNREQPSVQLQVRIGIATGEAVWAVEERDWFGLAVNTAARLCAAAEPDQVLIAAPGAGVLAGRTRPIGDRVLKGLAEPVPTWEGVDVEVLQDPVLPVAVGVREGPPFIDRPAEMARLRSLVSGCETAGRYQRAGTVLVVGDAGLGKTRLVREVLSTSRLAATAVLYGRANVSDTDPLDALREATRGYLSGLTDRQLDDLLAVAGADVAALAPAVRLRRPDLQMLVAADPATCNRAFLAVVEYAARSTPVIVVIDDLHHAGGAVVDALEALVAAVPGRVLVVGVSRADGSLWPATAARLAAWPTLTVGPVTGNATREILSLSPETDAIEDTVDEVERVSAGHVGTVVDIANRLHRMDRADWPAAIAAGGGPYRGLTTFLEGDAHYFFGRTALIDTVADRLRVNRIVGILGVSGSGKSSLARAGLLPRLRADAESASWVIVVMTPGRSPFASLASAIAELPSVADGAVEIEARLRDGVDGLDAIGRTLAPGRHDRLLVMVDQLEELFTEAPAEDRRAFADLLCHATMAPGGPVSLCVTLRADFYGRLTDLPVLAAAVHGNHVLVGPMNVQEIRDAVELPAAVGGFRLEAGLSDAFVRDVSGQVGALPLLSHALRETWLRRHGRTLTLAGYRDAGRLQGAIARTADASLDALDPGDRERARQLFLRLVNPGEGASDTRRQVDRAELSPELNRLVDHFVAARLITVDDGSVQLAHEALITEWPRFRNWLDQDREGLRTHRHLTDTASAWASRQRDPAELYRGARLQAANDLVANGRSSLNDVETEFLAASTQRQRAGARRTRRVVAGLAVLTAVSAVAAGFAVQSQRRAKTQQTEAETQKAVAETQKAAADTQRAEADRQRILAETGQSAAKDSATKAQQSAQAAQTAKTGSQLTTLASQSLALRSGQRDVAALLAVESWRRRPDAAAKSALFGTFTFDPTFVSYLTFGKQRVLYGVEIPGTTRMLANVSTIGSPDIFAAVIDVMTGEVVQRLEPLSTDMATDFDFAVSGDGRLGLVTAIWYQSPEKALTAVYDLSTGKKVGPVIEQPKYRQNLALDATGSTLAITTGADGQVTAYDAHTAVALGTVPALTEPPNNPDGAQGGAVAYGPDGRLYVGSVGTHLRVFDPKTFALVDDITVPLYATAHNMRFTADGSSFIATGTFDDLGIGGGERQRGSVARIDLKAKRTVWVVGETEFGYGGCAYFGLDEDTDRMWCGNYFGQVNERSLSTGALTGNTLASQRGLNGTFDVVRTPKGVFLVGIGSNSGVINRWQIDGGGAIARHVAGDRQIAGIFPDNRTLLVSRPDSGLPPPLNNSYVLWDATTDTEIPGLPKMVYASVVGSKVSGVFADFGVGTYDLTTGRGPTFPLDLHVLPSATGGTADGTKVAFGYYDGHFEIYEGGSGKLLASATGSPSAVPGPGIYGISMSDDGSRIYVAGGGLWSFDASGKELGHNDRGQLAAVRAGPPGVLIVGEVEGTLFKYDPDTLQPVQSMPGSVGLMSGLQLSDDASTLLGQGNGDHGAVSLYDLGTGTRLGDPIQNPHDVYCSGCFALRSDGKQMAITGPGGQGTVLWDLDPEHWLTAACTAAGRNLTKQEWTTYLGDLGDYHATCPQYPLSS